MDFQCETTCLIYVKSNLLSYMTINMFKHYHKNILIKKYINAAVKEATNYSDWIIASEFFKWWVIQYGLIQLGQTWVYFIVI